MSNQTEVQVSENTVPAVEVAELVKLADTAKLADVIKAVNALIEKSNSKRDRGPNSTREMTDDDAKRVILGDLKDVAHGKAAEQLGLSYGQVYSARGGYTFKPIYNEWKKANRDRSMAGPAKK